MKPNVCITALVLLICILLQISCKKEYSCKNCLGNKSPIANAGNDTSITLPSDSILLDGSLSSDPDDDIAGNEWTKISGPSTFTISNANAVQTQVTNLVQGIYQFELKVTDAGGLFSKDTIEIAVYPFSSQPTSCNAENRPLINAQLIPIGSLSVERRYVTIAAAGTKVLFAGGADVTDGSFEFTRVDIYDTITHTWSITELSVPRYNMQVTVYGNKIFFSGGHTVLQNNWSLFSTVDIYDVITNSWSTAQLSERRMDLAACLVGNKILFGGGLGGPGDQAPTHVSTKVDEYDLANNTWTTSSLSQPRARLSGVTNGSRIYFAGGNREKTSFTASCNPTSRVDMFDNGINSRSTLEMNTLVSNMAAIYVGGKIYWAGGEVANCGSSFSLSNEVQIFDPNTQTYTYSCLFQPNAGFKAVTKNDNIIFFTGEGSVKDRFDIYNVTTGQWSIGLLPQPIFGLDIYSYNNVVYVSDGLTAWKLEF